MKNSLLLALICLLFTSSSTSVQPRTRMFEVRVEARISSSRTMHDVVGEARNLADARAKAQRVVQARLTTKATRVKEIKQP